MRLMASTKTAVLAVFVALIIVIAGAIGYLYLATGVLNVELTDPPSGWGNASQIYLNYSSIEVHLASADDSSGWFTVISRGDEVNLTSVLNLNRTLGSARLQPATYNLIRFELNSAEVTIGGQNVTATVPSGKLQIEVAQGGLVLKAGQTQTILIQLNIAVHGADQNPTIVPDIRAIPV